MNQEGELTPGWRQICRFGLFVYAILIVLMCFLPQDIYPQYKSFSTPGIIQIGRFYLLLIPFNSFINGNQVSSFTDFLLVLGQNVVNIFLLTPLVFGLICLRPSWRSWKMVLRNSFLLSLFIESTQLVLDGLLNIGRVFEIDDLWTNSLGGLVAYWLYLLIRRWSTLVNQKSKNS